MNRDLPMCSIRRAVITVLLFPISLLIGQTGTTQENPAGIGDPDRLTQLDMQGNIPLEGLLKFTSREFGINYSYTPDVGSRRVTIQSPTKIPARALPLLVSSVLRANGLAVVDGDLPGWKKIVPSGDMYALAPFDTADNVLQRDGVGAPVTQLFLLKKYSPETITALVKHLFPGSQSSGQGQLNIDPNTNLPIPPTNQGTRMYAMSEANILILTDYAGNIKKIAEFVELIDRAAATVFEFYQVKNQKSEAVTEQAKKVLESRGAGGSIQSGVDQNGQPIPSSGGGASSGPVRFFDDKNANRVVVVGRRDLVDEALELLARFDVSLDIKEKIFRPKNMTAERLQTIVEGFLPPQDEERTYKGTVDQAGNLFVVRATPDIIKKIDEIIEMLDQSPSISESPIQWVKLKNAKAEEVLTTLLALQDVYGSQFGGGMGGGLGGVPFFGGAFGGGVPGFGGGLPFGGGMGGFGQGGFGNGFGGGFGGGFGQGGFGGMGNQGFQSQQLPLPPGQATSPGATTGATGTTTGATGGSGSRGGRNSQRGQQGGQAAGGFGGFGGSATLPGGVRVTADIATNSLILIGPANVQPIYMRLIEQLDQRRPQVLIEAKFIAFNSSDNFNFGVEFSGGDRTGAKRAFKFTSFGLSQVDPVTGALRIIPGQGANTTVVNPDVADMVLRALVTHTRAKVLSAPKILVNDNEEGQLESKVSIPFASVNASNTVATTSVGGSQEAGTTIFVTPHINEDDNLQLEFEIEFSTFTGTGTDTLPPARQIEKVSSVVTVPDGQTVIVGGLKRTADNQTYAGVPWFEKIPIIRDLLGRTGETKDQTSFFVFLRPLILRDSKFGDLQYISDRQAGLMGIPSEFPSSEPVLLPACPTPAVIPASYSTAP